MLAPRGRGLVDRRSADGSLWTLWGEKRDQTMTTSIDTTAVRLTAARLKPPTGGKSPRRARLELGVAYAGTSPTTLVRFLSDNAGENLRGTLEVDGMEDGSVTFHAFAGDVRLSQPKKGKALPTIDFDLAVLESEEGRRWIRQLSDLWLGCAERGDMAAELELELVEERLPLEG